MGRRGEEWGGEGVGRGGGGEGRGCGGEGRSGEGWGRGGGCHLSPLSMMDLDSMDAQLPEGTIWIRVVQSGWKGEGIAVRTLW